MSSHIEKSMFCMQKKRFAKFIVLQNCMNCFKKKNEKKLVKESREDGHETHFSLKHFARRLRFVKNVDMITQPLAKSMWLVLCTVFARRNWCIWNVTHSPKSSWVIFDWMFRLVRRYSKNIQLFVHGINVRRHFRHFIKFFFCFRIEFHAFEAFAVYRNVW